MSDETGDPGVVVSIWNPDCGETDGEEAEERGHKLVRLGFLDPEAAALELAERDYREESILKAQTFRVRTNDGVVHVIDVEFEAIPNFYVSSSTVRRP